MYTKTFWLFCIMLLNVPVLQSISGEAVITFDVLYNAGIEAYAQEKWTECKEQMEKALEDYKHFIESVASCRLKCDANNIPSADGDGDLSLEMTFFRTALTRSDCLRRCRKERLPGRPESINLQRIEDFESLLVYDYLQICAYKSEEYALAAAASFTFLVAHPEHTVMKNNVQFYRTLPELSSEHFINLELEMHQELYIDGVDFYGQQDYKTTIKKMEKSLSEYYIQHRRCSVLCEAHYDHASLPDLYNAIADHWISVVQCKQKCPSKLATVNGAIVQDYLAEHYNYLQFAYYKESKLKPAAACAATYLLFKPDNDMMLRNVAYYEKLDGITADDIIPRKSAHEYIINQKAEQKMLEFAQSEYKYSDADEDDGKGANREVKDGPVTATEQVHATDYFSYEDKESKAFGQRDEMHHAKFDAFLKRRGYELSVKNDKPSGSSLLVVDGLLTEGQCADLIALSRFGAIGSESGTKLMREPSDGISFTDLSKLVRNGAVDADIADLFLNTGKNILEMEHRYYNLKWPLHTDSQHVVCMQPSSDLDGKMNAKTSPSWHSDNCIRQPDGGCLKEEPSRWWRDLTSVLFLNDDFEGGELVLGLSNESDYANVKPKCGRLATFNASHMYGTMDHSGGLRCVLGVWSTLDPNRQNTEEAEARVAISTTKKVSEVPNLKAFVDENAIEISRTEEDLGGPERFAADNVIDEETCRMLIELANVAGVQGDGYRKGGLTSVNTENETYVGLTVSKAAELAASMEISSGYVKSYIEKSILVKETVSRYFNLDKPLYFDYTHLVCRTSIHGADKVRTDLSHPVHSDNCIIQADNTCLKIPPAYVQRDYSALLYLNDNFTGGDFFFTHQNMSIQATVRPKCGRMVGFNAGNYHGVEAVTSGQRCALAGWYTHDPKFQERAYDIADDILKNLEKVKPLGPPASDHSHKEL